MKWDARWPVLFLLMLAGCGGPPPQGNEVERIERGNLVIEGIPPIPASLEDSLRHYGNTRSAAFVDWNLQGRGMLIATRFGQVNQLHWVARPLAARRQITFYDESVTDAVFAPAAGSHDGFLFTKDKGGDANYQIYFFDWKTGKTRLLTGGQSRNDSAVWSHAGDRFTFRSNRRNGTNWDIWLARPDGGRPEMVFEGKGYWLPAVFSPDDSKLAIGDYLSITNSTLAMLDIDSGETTDIRVGDAPAFSWPLDFTPDGSGLYFLSDVDSEFRGLRRYDFASRHVTTLGRGFAADVESADLSDDGRLLAFAVNQRGLSVLHIRTTDDWRDVPVPTLPAGVIDDLKFSPDGRSLAFTLVRATAPADVFVYDLAHRILVPWTASEAGGLDPAGFVSPRLISFKSFDGLEVPAFVYEPKGPGPHPVLILIHGGPEGQYRPRFSPFVQYLVNEMGVAVVAPNVRGSSGYGKAYVGLDNGRKREDSVKDIGALLDWIAAEPSLDETRVIVYGGSYGGYMVLASMVHYGERLLGGIEYDGVSNFVTSLENTASYRKDFRRAEYGDERDPEMRAFLESVSPLNHADSITKPLFVIQGLNDAQVPVGQSEQMVAQLRAHGTEVWYLLAKDEGHGFHKKANRDYQMAAMVLFLGHLLEGRGGPR